MFDNLRVSWEMMANRVCQETWEKWVVMETRYDFFFVMHTSMVKANLSVKTHRA